MTFQTETELFQSEPLVLCKIELDAGDEYLAKVDVVSTNFWQGLVKNFGNISRSVSHVNSSFKTSDVTVTCFNTEQYFSENYDSKKLLNRVVSFHVGTTDLAIGSFKQIYRGTIQKFSYSSDKFTITVKDATDPYLDVKDYAKIIDSADWANCDDSVNGKRMPIIYGECTGGGPCKGLLIDTVNHKYLFAGHAVKAIDNAYSRDSDGNLLEITTGLTKTIAESFDGGYIATVTFTADMADYDIVANIDGVEDSAGADGSGTLISNPVTQLEHFLTTWLSLPSALYNSTDFTAAETLASGRSYAGAGIIPGTKSAKKVIQDMALCFNGMVFHNTDGELSVNIFDITDLEATLRQYTDQNEILQKSFKIKPQLKNLCNKVIAKYAYDAGLNTYKEQYIYEDSTAQTASDKVYEKEIKLPFVNVTVMAQDIAQRFIKTNKYPPMEISFNTTLAGLNNDLTDIFQVTHFAGLESGGYDERLFRIEKIQPALDQQRVKITALDVASLLTNTFILGDETAIASSWATATDADKYYGYLADETDELFANNTDDGKCLY